MDKHKATALMDMNEEGITISLPDQTFIVVDNQLREIKGILLEWRDIYTLVCALDANWDKLQGGSHGLTS